MSLLDDFYNTFDPSPLEAGSPLYVDCKAVRGGADVLIELGRKVQRSQQSTVIFGSPGRWQIHGVKAVTARFGSKRLSRGLLLGRR